MSDGPRALLTPRERDALRDPDDMTADTRRSLLGRVRRKIEENLATDARIIREHDDELADLLHEAVCQEETDERLDAVEEELAELREELGIKTDETDDDGSD